MIQIQSEVRPFSAGGGRRPRQRSEPLNQSQCESRPGHQLKQFQSEVWPLPTGGGRRPCKERSEPPNQIRFRPHPGQQEKLQGEYYTFGVRYTFS